MFYCYYSILNLQAHYQQRRAETHLRYRRFEEAIECHQTAAKYLDEALNYVTVPRATESIRLQRDYHIKQQDVIRIKKEQFENYKKAVENQRRRMANAFNNKEFEDKEGNESTSLQTAIYKTMEEADSLLEILIKRGTSDSDSIKSDISSADTDDRVVTFDTVDGESTSSNQAMGSKRPKDDHTVIEELRTLNQQLHSLVYQLVTQLDASSREADALRARVKYLESERLKSENSQNDTEPLRNNNLRIVTDSSGGTSPYVFSPCSELSPDVGDPRTMPTLAPLELPTFDFSNLTKFSKSQVMSNFK